MTPSQCLSDMAVLPYLPTNFYVTGFETKQLIAATRASYPLTFTGGMNVVSCNVSNSIFANRIYRMEF